MTRPQKLAPIADKDSDALRAEVARLVEEAESSGFEPHTGMDGIKAAGRKRLKQARQA